MASRCNWNVRYTPSKMFSEKITEYHSVKLIDHKEHRFFKGKFKFLFWLSLSSSEFLGTELSYFLIVSQASSPNFTVNCN